MGEYKENRGDGRYGGKGQGSKGCGSRKPEANYQLSATASTQRRGAARRVSVYEHRRL